VLGPPVFGAIVSASGSYGAGFVFIGVLPLAAGLGLFFFRRDTFRRIRSG
jgi:hypothetical protein